MKKSANGSGCFRYDRPRRRQDQQTTPPLARPPSRPRRRSRAIAEDRRACGLDRGQRNAPQFDPDIPWNSGVISRARELERENWGASAAGEAVARTFNAIVTTTIVVASTALPR